MEGKRLLYIEVHQLKKQGFRISQIAKRTRLSRTTVYKYLELDFEEAIEEFDTTSRKRKLDKYQDWIVNWLKEYPTLSGAQVFDWLQEKFPEIDIGESTVRRYVNDMRDIYNIEKKETARDYDSVEELPFGQQLQVDWGQTIQKTVEGKDVKLYFIAFVLANSRHKYKWWLNRPFTTEDTIRFHEQAFEFYGGMPEEIVYDQDNLIAVSENAGDLLLTTSFQQYVRQRKFRIYLCRKADPESKGKVENVVKYVKNNFAKNRVFSNLEDWNEKGLKWLERTGNYKVHNTTKKRPFEVFLLEKQHLRKVSNPLSSESNYTESITRNVRKDNTIHYLSNRYSVPPGTYNKMALIKLQVSNGILKVCDPSTGEVIQEHKVSLEKGKLIKDRGHSRERSRTLDTLKQEVLDLLQHEKAADFILRIDKDYGRYRRDQYVILKKTAQLHPSWIHMALEKCMEENLISANSFRDVVNFLVRTVIEEPLSPEVIEKPLAEIAVETRDMDAYLQLMGGKKGE